MRPLNLRKVSKVVEYVSILTLICGIIVTIILSVDEVPKSIYSNRTKTIIHWGLLFGGIAASFIQSILILFVSRLGYTIADIRDKVNPAALEAEEKEEEEEL